MITLTNKSVFDSGCDLLVNTINCHGVMGAGLALEFSLRYPKMFDSYKKECESGLIKTGQTYLYIEKGQKILNFPTKGDEPKNPSSLEYIKSGLEYFRLHYKEYGAKSVAFPPLGCTNGKLNFEKQVKPLMFEMLKDINDLNIVICLNNFPLYGIEKKMTEKFFSIKKDSFKNCFDSDEDFLHFTSSVSEIKRFSQLASKKYLPSEMVYRKIWQFVFERIKEEN